MLDSFAKIEYICSANLKESHTAFFLAKSLNRWDTSFYMNDGAIMSQDNQNPAGVKKPKLLDQVRAAICTRHYSMKTDESYVYWIMKFILFRKSIGARLRLCSSLRISKTHCGLKK
jgi:hypothetical protein